MEVTQSNATTEVAENFAEDTEFQEYISNPGADWIDADDICLKLTEDMNNKLWGETPLEPQHLVASMLGFKINDNVILLGDDRLIKKLGNVVIGVIAEWKQVHRIFKFFELEVEDKTDAKDYAVLGLQYIKRLKLARDDDISVLVGDQRLNFFRLNKGGILNVDGAIAIGAHQNLANVQIRDFSADKTYEQVERIGKSARRSIIANGLSSHRLWAEVCIRRKPGEHKREQGGLESTA